MATATQAADAAVGTYLVPDLIVGKVGTPGAPILHMSLLVEAATGKVVGHGRITQAVAKQQTIDINNINGVIHQLGLGPARRVVELTGSYTEPPTTIVLGFSATLLIQEDRWEGQGSFTYGTNHVENVPVTSGPS